MDLVDELFVEDERPSTASSNCGSLSSGYSVERLHRDSTSSNPSTSSNSNSYIQSVLNGEQFQHEHTPYRSYSPFNNCKCTANVVCNYCSARYMGKSNDVSPTHSAHTPASKGILTPVLKKPSPKLPKNLCNIHGWDQDYYYYCKTCCGIFCLSCQVMIHYGHDLLPLPEAIEVHYKNAVMIFNAASTAIERINKELAKIQASANTLEVAAKKASADLKSLVKRRSLGRRHTKEQEDCLNDITNTKRCQMENLQRADHELRKCLDLLRISIEQLYWAMEASNKSVSNPLDLILPKDRVMSFIYRLHKFLKTSLPTPVHYPSLIGDGRPLLLEIPIGLGRAIPCSENHITVLPYAFNPYLTTVIGVTPVAVNNLCRPWGITCDKLGNFIVVDRSNHRILIYQEDGSFVRAFGKLGPLPGEFYTPAGVAVDEERRIIVADKDNHRIQIFTMYGIFLHTFGMKGSSIGQFIYPWDVAVNSLCQIVVSDTRNNRIQLFSPHGTFLKSFGHVNNVKILDVPRGLCFTLEGNVLVCDFNNHRIIEVDSDFINSKVVVDRNDVSHSIDRPQGIAIDDDGNLIIADSRNNRIQIRNRVGVHILNLRPAGTQGVSLDRPSGVAVTPKGKIATVDFGNNRILIL